MLLNENKKIELNRILSDAIEASEDNTEMFSSIDRIKQLILNDNEVSEDLKEKFQAFCLNVRDLISSKVIVDYTFNIENETIDESKEWMKNFQERYLTVKDIYKQSVIKLQVKEKLLAFKDNPDEKNLKEILLIGAQRFRSIKDDRSIMESTLKLLFAASSVISFFEEKDYQDEQLSKAHLSFLNAELEFYFAQVQYIERSKKVLERIEGIYYAFSFLHALQYSHDGLAHILHQRGYVYSYLRDADAAISFYRNALALFESERPKNDLEKSELLLNLGRVYLEQKSEFDTARKFLYDSIKIYELVVDLEHTNLVNSLINFSEAFFYLGHSQEAISAMERVLEIQRSHYQPSDIKIGETLSNLAMIRALRLSANSGKTEFILNENESELYFALIECLSALGIYRTQYGKNHIEIAKMLEFIGLLRGKLKDLIGGVEAYEEAFNIYQVVYSEDGDKISAFLAGIKASCDKHQLPQLYQAFQDRIGSKDLSVGRNTNEFFQPKQENQIGSSGKSFNL